jgi:maleylacetate reductase
VRSDFTWRDGERLIRFGGRALGEAPRLLEGAGFSGYALLTTERAASSAPAIPHAARVMLQVPAGRVDEVSAGLLDAAGDRPLVGLGGGRVIDTAKAIAGARGTRCAAVPTTLSGAEMTPFHRTPVGVQGARLVRPALVVAAPELMVSLPLAPLAATAMNALAHAVEALYTPLANPVAEMAALRCAELIAEALPRDEPPAPPLALAALLAGYASGAAGLAVHHAVCQSIVRVTGSPHAETNAVMLPHFARLMAHRAPGEMGALAGALGDPGGDPEAAGGRVAKLAARCGHVRLSTLGVGEQHLDEIVRLAARHGGISMTPEPPDERELRGVLEAAL